MKMMNDATVKAINQALLFNSKEPYERPEIRPWQYVQMEYTRVGMSVPARMPEFETVDDAQIWMCLDREYNNRLREVSYAAAV